MPKIVLGLHLYQPPLQDPEVLKKIEKESYIPVCKTILETGGKICADFPLSVLEQLSDEVLVLLKKCIDYNLILPIQTAAYHPILPLMPKDFIENQIKLNIKAYKKYFGKKGEGFFPPEMAFSCSILEQVKKFRLTWTVADDTYVSDPPFNKILKWNGVKIFLMSHYWQNKMTFNNISGQDYLRLIDTEFLNYTKTNDCYLILWCDWETFGHHHDNINSFLKPFLKFANLVFPSELIFSTEERYVSEGSWSPNPNPFHLWNNDSNFHRKWRKLASKILKSNKKIKDKLLFSCPLWWASRGNLELAEDWLAQIFNLYENKKKR